VLDEVGADFAVMNSLPQAAASPVDVWEDRAVSLLVDPAIEDAAAAVYLVEIRFVWGLIVKLIGEM
jgi:hypothetical protein